MSEAFTSEELGVDSSNLPSDSVVIVNDRPFISQLPNDGSSILKWASLGESSDCAVEELVVKTKIRMMGAMLLDSARNEAYKEALSKVIKPGDVVLDAGAGTGLLSMLAAHSGARHVYACEMNEYFSKICERVVKDNNLDKVVQVLAKRTTDLVSGPLEGKDTIEEVDVIVTETMDSVLTTEGIIQTIKDAKIRLGRKDGRAFRVIPQSGRMIGRLVHTKPTGKLRPLYEHFCESDVNGEPLYIHADTKRFQEDVEVLNADVDLINLNFNDVTAADDRVESILDFQIEEGYAAQPPHALLVFWKVELCDGIYISTVPGNSSWQDHWHHALYFLRPPTLDSSNTNLHYQVHFALNMVDGTVSIKSRELPDVKRGRKDEDIALFPLETSWYQQEFAAKIQASIADLTSASKYRLVDLSPSSANLPARLSPVVENLEVRSLILRLQASSNSGIRTTFANPEQETVALFAPESPRYEIDSAMVFLYRCANFQEPRQAAMTLPCNCVVKCCLVDFEHLRNPRNSLEEVCGLKHGELFRAWSAESKRPWVFPLALYNYEYRVTSQDSIVVSSMDFASSQLKFSESNAELTCAANETSSAVVFWVEWYFSNNVVSCLGSPLSSSTLSPFGYCQCQFLDREVSQGQKVSISCSIDSLTNRLVFACVS